MAINFRERLTANANDFDGIVADMLSYIEKLERDAGLAWNPSELTKIGTVLPGDPYDEREGLYMDRKEMKSLHALPVGAVLYAKLP